jgi:Tfp pilus assembly protein PilO
VSQAIENMLLKFKNRKLVVIVVPVLLGLFAGHTLVVRPGLRQLHMTQDELDTLSKKEGSYNFILNNEKKMEGYQQALKGADKTWLIEHINEAGSKSGVSINSISPDEQRKIGDHLLSIPVRVEAEATYHQLGEFVSQLESSEQFLKILNLSLQGSASQSQGQGGGPAVPDGLSRSERRNDCKISMSIAVFSIPAAAS